MSEHDEQIRAEERARLLGIIQEFDATDDYHRNDYAEPGYSAAIARVETLLEGHIKSWLSPRPTDAVRRNEARA